MAGGAATANDRVQLGHALRQADDWAGAGEAYRAATLAVPLEADGHRQYAAFLRQDGQAEAAAGAVLRALVLAPGDAALLADLDALGISPEEIDARMVTALLGGADSAPTPAGAWQRIRTGILRRAARRAARAGRWVDAERAYRAMLAIAPHQPRVLLQLGHALRERGDAAAAVSVYRHALLCRPRHAEPWLHLGHAFKALARPVAARQAYLAAWRLQPGFAAAAEELHAGGWDRDDLAQLATGTWAAIDPGDAGQLDTRLGPPAGLNRRERATWAYLAIALGQPDRT